MKTKQQQLKEGIARRSGNKDFSHLKLKKKGKDKVYELLFNGRLYRNSNKQALIDDITTVENG